MIYALGDRKPLIDNSCFVAPDATVIGSVSIGRNSSIWFNVVIRADHDLITIGEDSNIQDGSVLHVDAGVPLRIGDRVTVGHKVMLHGCTVGDGSLIGINAVVLNGAVIGNGCLIAANALVTENMQVADGAVVMGSPGKVVRIMSAEQREGLAGNAAHYVRNAQLFRDKLQAIARD